jgi:hypothetical protein
MAGLGRDVSDLAFVFDQSHCTGPPRPLRHAPRVGPHPRTPHRGPASPSIRVHPSPSESLYPAGAHGSAEARIRGRRSAPRIPPVRPPPPACVRACVSACLRGRDSGLCGAVPMRAQERRRRSRCVPRPCVCPCAGRPCCGRPAAPLWFLRDGLRAAGAGPWGRRGRLSAVGERGRDGADGGCCCAAADAGRPRRGRDGADAPAGAAQAPHAQAPPRRLVRPPSHPPESPIRVFVRVTYPSRPSESTLRLIHPSRFASGPARALANAAPPAPRPCRDGAGSWGGAGGCGRVLGPEAWPAPGGR